MEPRYKSETEERDVWQEVGQRVRTYEDHRQVSVLAMVLALLRGFEPPGRSWLRWTRIACGRRSFPRY